MDERPPDFIPPTPPTTKTGAANLNALKYGRYSRFKNVLPPEPFDPAVAARSILLQQRTEAERIAASSPKPRNRVQRKRNAQTVPQQPTPPTDRPE